MSDPSAAQEKLAVWLLALLGIAAAVDFFILMLFGICLSFYSDLKVGRAPAKLPSPLHRSITAKGLFCNLVSSSGRNCASAVEFFLPASCAFWGLLVWKIGGRSTGRIANPPSPPPPPPLSWINHYIKRILFGYWSPFVLITKWCSAASVY